MNPQPQKKTSLSFFTAVGIAFVGLALSLLGINMRERGNEHFSGTVTYAGIILGFIALVLFWNSRRRSPRT